MRRINDSTRERQKRGRGSGADYRPYIKSREFNSLGTCVRLIDYVTKRCVELHSQGESHLWYILRFQDDIVEIKEQVPLDLNCTLNIAKNFGLKHPKNNSTHMTTDLLAIFSDGHQHAYSVKANMASIQNKRTKEILFIEKNYWQLLGIDYSIEFKDQMNFIYSENIRNCSYYYDLSSITDKISCLKHLIITKQIHPNLTEEKLNYSKLLNEYDKEVSELWTKIFQSNLATSYKI